MTGTKFTPGPWGISYGFDLKGGKCGVYVSGPRPDQIGIKLASPWREGAWDGDPEAAANAHLISAAPELYEVLGLAAEELATIAVGMGEHGWSAADVERHESICAVGDKIAAVLAKARGESA